VAKFVKINAGSLLAGVPADKQFWCSNGRIMRNLYELSAALNEMSEETFTYHANESKNDFAKWVREVIGDEKLARDLQKSKTPSQAAKTVADRVAWLKDRLEPI
jgi:hypothetical protein